jgi:hypothetical protein
MRWYIGLLLALFVAGKVLAQGVGASVTTRIPDPEPPKPPGPWWECGGENLGANVTPEQQRRLVASGRERFSLTPGDGPGRRWYSAADVLKRFGKPDLTRNDTVVFRAMTPDEKDHVILVTSWDYPGFRILTGAAPARPAVLWIRSVEVFDARVALLHGLRVGQSIDQWERELGRPECDELVSGRSSALSDSWTADYFACAPGESCREENYNLALEIDAGGAVTKVIWMVYYYH